MTLNKRQKMLLEKAVDCLEDIGEYDTIPFETTGYDGQEFDPYTLANDLKSEFDIEQD